MLQYTDELLQRCAGAKCGDIVIEGHVCRAIGMCYNSCAVVEVLHSTGDTVVLRFLFSLSKPSSTCVAGDVVALQCGVNRAGVRVTPLHGSIEQLTVTCDQGVQGILVARRAPACAADANANKILVASTGSSPAMLRTFIGRSDVLLCERLLDLPVWNAAERLSKKICTDVVIGQICILYEHNDLLSRDKLFSIASRMQEICSNLQCCLSVGEVLARCVVVVVVTATGDLGVQSPAHLLPPGCFVEGWALQSVEDAHDLLREVSSLIRAPPHISLRNGNAPAPLEGVLSADFPKAMLQNLTQSPVVTARYRSLVLLVEVQWKTPSLLIVRVICGSMVTGNVVALNPGDFDVRELPAPTGQAVIGPMVELTQTTKRTEVSIVARRVGRCSVALTGSPSPPAHPCHLVVQWSRPSQQSKTYLFEKRQPPLVAVDVNLPAADSAAHLGGTRDVLLVFILVPRSEPFTIENLERIISRLKEICSICDCCVSTAELLGRCVVVAQNDDIIALLSKALPKLWVKDMLLLEADATCMEKCLLGYLAKRESGCDVPPPLSLQPPSSCLPSQTDDTAHQPQSTSLKLTLRYHNAETKHVIESVDGPRIMNAFTRYIQKSHTAALKILSHSGPTSIDELFTPESGTNEIAVFRSPPAGCGFASVVDVASRGSYQNSVWCKNGGDGYLAFPFGEDFLGEYQLFPCGYFTDAFVSRIAPPPATAAGSAHRFDMCTATVTEIAVVEASCRREMGAIEIDGGAAVPDETMRRRREMQAWMFKCFVDRFTDDKVVQLFPSVNKKWAAGVKADVQRLAGDCGGVAVDIVSDLLEGTHAPGHLIRGLPGVGKSRLSRIIIGCMGLVPTQKILDQWCPSIGMFVAGQYKGDVTSAFKAMLTRPRFVSGPCVCLFDEMDITARREKETMEQVAQWLTNFTKEAKAPNFHLLCTTNNDKGIVGAILSRFCGRIVTATTDTVSSLTSIFESLHCAGNMHPFCSKARLTLGNDNLNCCMLAARSAVGLASRSIFSKTAAPDVLHVEMGNVFYNTISHDRITVADLARAKNQSSHALEEFFICAARYLTGRIVVYCHTPTEVYVDVEVKPVVESNVLSGHTIRSSPRFTSRHYVFPSLTAVLQSLFVVACHREFNVKGFYYLSQEFFSMIVGAQQTTDREDLLIVGASLIRDFCVHTPGSTMLFFPMERLAVRDDDGRSICGYPRAIGAFFGAEGLFLRSAVQSCSIIICRTAAELRVVRDEGMFPLSPLTEVMLAGASTTSSRTFTCVVCHTTNVSKEDVGCDHVPVKTLDVRCHTRRHDASAEETTPLSQVLMKPFEYAQAMILCTSKCNTICGIAGDTHHSARGSLGCPRRHHTAPCTTRFLVDARMRRLVPCSKCNSNETFCSYCARLIPRETRHKLYMDELDDSYLLRNGQLFKLEMNINDFKQTFVVPKERQYHISFNLHEPPFSIAEEPISFLRLQNSKRGLVVGIKHQGDASLLVMSVSLREAESLHLRVDWRRSSSAVVKAVTGWTYPISSFLNNKVPEMNTEHDNVAIQCATHGCTHLTFPIRQYGLKCLGCQLGDDCCAADALPCCVPLRQEPTSGLVVVKPLDHLSWEAPMKKLIVEISPNDDIAARPLLPPQQRNILRLVEELTLRSSQGQDAADQSIVPSRTIAIVLAATGCYRTLVLTLARCDLEGVDIQGILQAMPFLKKLVIDDCKIPKLGIALGADCPVTLVM